MFITQPFSQWSGIYSEEKIKKIVRARGLGQLCDNSIVQIQQSLWTCKRKATVKLCTRHIQAQARQTYHHVERQVDMKLYPYTRGYLKLTTADTGKISFPQRHDMGIGSTLQVKSYVQHKSYSIVLGLC